MKYRNFLIILPIGAMLVLTSCGNSSKRPAVTSKESKDLYSYYLDTNKMTFVKTDLCINTYYFNKSSIPYVSLKDYVDIFLSKPYRESYCSYSYSQNGGNAYIKLNNDEKYKATATINTDAQTISYDTYSGFMSNGNYEKYPLFAVMGKGEYLFKDLQYECKEGSTYSIDLTKYNIKAYFDNDEIYLPYHVAVTAFGSYKDTFTYNGNGYYFIPSLSQEATTFLVIKMVRDAIANGAYNEEYQNFAYDHLAFTFDNYFGLDKRQKRTGNKEEHTFFKDGAYNSLSKYKADLISTQPNVSNNALMNFYNECVNDGGHSGYSDYNLFSTDTNKIKQNGDFEYVANSYYALSYARKNKQLDPSKFGDDFSGYVQTLDNVLFVTIDEFISSKDKYTREDFSDTEYGKCAISVIGRANEEVQNNKNIKNVVLDLSCNHGGAGYMPLQILSWINKGNMKFTVKNNMDGTILKGSGHADINLDGTFDSKDYLADDINIYLMCSPASFSSGNYVPCLASEVSKVKFIGERSGGGSCNVSTKENALGSIMGISGDIQLCFNNLVDGKIISDEVGVTPSYYPISLPPDGDYKNAQLFFDRQAIVNKILGK